MLSRSSLISLYNIVSENHFIIPYSSYHYQIQIQTSHFVYGITIIVLFCFILIMFLLDFVLHYGDLRSLLISQSVKL